MTVTTLTSQQFNRDNAGAKRAAKRGPVFITSRGEASHVLLSIEEYRRLANDNKSIVDLLGMPLDDDFEFDVPKIDEIARVPDL